MAIDNFCTVIKNYLCKNDHLSLIIIIIVVVVVVGMSINREEELVKEVKVSQYIFIVLLTRIQSQI